MPLPRYWPGRLPGQFEKEREIDQKASALAVPSEVLFLQEKREETENAIELALHISDKIEDRPMQMFIARKAAAVSIGSAMSVESSQRLKGCDRRKQEIYLVSELESRLALGKLELRTGKARQGRAILTAVERDAASKRVLLHLAESGSIEFKMSNWVNFIANRDRGYSHGLGLIGRIDQIPTFFLSILSIKCGNWFYWLDKEELYRHSGRHGKPIIYFDLRFIWLGINGLQKNRGVRIPLSPPELCVWEFISNPQSG